MQTGTRRQYGYWLDQADQTPNLILISDYLCLWAVAVAVVTFWGRSFDLDWYDPIQLAAGAHVTTSCHHSFDTSLLYPLTSNFSNPASASKFNPSPCCTWVSRIKFNHHTLPSPPRFQWQETVSNDAKCWNVGVIWSETRKSDAQMQDYYNKQNS